MNSIKVDELLGDPVRSCVLRYLVAADAPIRERFLTEKEREAVQQLEAASVVARPSDGVIALSLESGSLDELKARLLEVPGSITMTSAAELERLRLEHREYRELLSFVQDLNRSIIASGSMSELFDAAFRKLHETLPFDVGVGVMLEQRLDLFLSSRENLGRNVDQKLSRDIRELLQSQIPVSFDETDAVVRGESTDLPAREGAGESLDHHLVALLEQEERPAGMLALFRGDRAFDEEDRRLLEILATQVAMVLGNIRAQEKIQNLADQDDLTGTWNKRYIRQRLASEVERSKTYKVPLALLMLDVDEFKSINDTYGHLIGDVVLSEICGTVKQSLRPPDIIGRFGGDEFAIILPHTDLWGARTVAERIVETVLALQVPVDAERVISCSVSIGVAAYVDPMTAADLIQRADDRLYVSKNGGKGRASW